MSKNKDTKKTVSKISGNVNYPVGDFLIQLKNSSKAGKKTVEAAYSKFVLEVAKLLEKEGLLDSVAVEEGKLKISISYYKKEPVLTDLKLVSRPGLRIYKGLDALEKKKGPSFLIVSTPKGVMTSKEAIKKRLGGEVVAEIL